jgi:hypothetical protein
MGEQFTNAWVHPWLTKALAAAATKMQASRLHLNSAALYWFLKKLTPEQRAEALGEYVKALALHGQAEAARRAPGEAGEAARPRRKGKGKRG